MGQLAGSVPVVYKNNSITSIINPYSYSSRYGNCFPEDGYNIRNVHISDIGVSFGGIVEWPNNIFQKLYSMILSPYPLSVYYIHSQHSFIEAHGTAYSLRYKRWYFITLYGLGPEVRSSPDRDRIGPTGFRSVRSTFFKAVWTGPSNVNS